MKPAGKLAGLLPGYKWRMVSTGGGQPRPCTQDAQTPFVHVYYANAGQNRQERRDDLRKEVEERSNRTTHLKEKGGDNNG